jgi:hypothetical protein
MHCGAAREGLSEKADRLVDQALGEALEKSAARRQHLEE